MEWGVEIPEEQLKVKNYRKHQCQAVIPPGGWNVIYCLEDDELTLGHTNHSATIGFCPWCGHETSVIKHESGPTFQAYNWSPGPQAVKIP